MTIFLLTPDGRRIAAAAGASLACHALIALVLARIAMSPEPRPRPIVVTMLDAGGGGGAGGPAAAAAPPRAAAPPVAAGPPASSADEPRVAAVAEPIPPVAPPKPMIRAAPRSRPRSLPAPQPPAAAADARSTSTAASQAGVDAGGDSRGGAPGATGSAGRPGDGAGGADGLRVFCRDCPAPAYPSRARRQGWQGTVEVGLRVAADGSVASAAVERSSGYPALDDVALASARASRFAVPTGSGLDGRLRYRFVLDATAAER